MKKLFFFVLTVGTIAVSITSCTKDWTCECEWGGLVGDTVLTDTKKSDAKDYCDSQDAVISLLGGSCKLK